MYALNSLVSYDYVSAFSDPRLISAAHSGQKLVLDAPPLNGTVKMRDVDDINRSYGSVYNSISDINNGQILYYYDSEIGKPFIQPLFDDSSVVRVDYIDPMGTYKPHYYRDSTVVCGKGLTWLEDSQFQRNDIIASQIWKRNQTYPLLAYSL
jgi:hypothetical protein